MNVYEWMKSEDYIESNEYAKEASELILKRIPLAKCSGLDALDIVDNWLGFFSSFKVYAFFAIGGDFVKEKLIDQYGLSKGEIGINATQLISVPDFLTRIYSYKELNPYMKFYLREFCDAIWDDDTMLYHHWAHISNPLYMPEAELIHDAPSRLFERSILKI